MSDSPEFKKVLNRARFIGNLIRVGMEIALLVGVWHHTHWTVGLSITILGLSMESQIITNGYHKRLLKVHSEVIGMIIKFHEQEMSGFTAGKIYERKGMD